MYIDSSKELKKCFNSQLILRISIAYKENPSNVSKREESDRQSYSKAKIQKILKFSTQKQQYSKEYYIMTKVGIMFIINLV